MGVLGVLFSIRKYRESVLKNRNKILIFIIISLSVSVLLWLFLRQEYFISYWEFGGYWKKSLEFNDLLRSDVNVALDYLFSSIRTQEYNYLALALLSGPTQIFGAHFSRFVLVVYNFCLLPFNVLLFSLVLMILDDNNYKNKFTLVLIILSIIFFSSNILPLILGYIGAVALPFIMSVVIIIYCGYLRKHSFAYSVYIGLVLIFIVLIRRWYAYLVVGFFLGYGISLIIEYIIEKKNFKKEILPVYIRLFICGIIPLLLLRFGIPELFNKITKYNYTFAYQIMNVGSFYERFLWFFKNYGLVFFALAIVGIVITLKNKKYKYDGIASIIMFLFIVIAFNLTQMMGNHHYYTINVLMILYSLIGLIYLCSLLSNKVLKILIVFTLLVTTINTSIIFTKSNESIIQKVNSIIIPSYLPSMRIRKDVNNIKDITLFLKNNVGNSSVYVLAGSEYLNEDLITNSFLPYDLKPVSNMASSKVWDFRDGIPKDFFKYQFVVTSSPSQYQFLRGGHKNIWVLAENITKKNGILNKFYDNIFETFIYGENDKEVKVIIYRRNQEIPRNVIDQFIDIFKRYYPDYPDLYEFNY